MLAPTARSRPSRLSADVGELQIRIDGHRATAGPGARWIGQELWVFPRSALLAGLAFLQAPPGHTHATWPWPGRLPIGPRQPRDKGSRVALPGVRSHVRRGGPRGARCVIAGLWGARLGGGDPNPEPGHRVLWLRLSFLTCSSGSSHLASSVIPGCVLTWMCLVPQACHTTVERIGAAGQHALYKRDNSRPTQYGDS